MENELIAEFIADLNYIDTIINSSNVFERIGEVKDKWNSQKETKSELVIQTNSNSSPSDTHTKDYGHKDLIDKDYEVKK